MIVEPDESPPVRRALPGHMIDLIRDGIPEDKLRAMRGDDRDQAIWSAARRTATSAQNRGWTRTSWASLVTENGSMLGIQIARKYNRWPPKARSTTSREAQLRKAWDSAAEWLRSAPEMSVGPAALERVQQIADAADKAAGDMTGPELAVWLHAVNEARRYESDRPALPRRGISAATGLGGSAIRTALGGLARQGWLRLEVPGRRGATSGKAGLYRLSHPGTCHIPIRGKACGPESLDRTYGPASSADLPSNVIPFARRNSEENR
jgi:hypothetical protein